MSVQQNIDARQRAVKQIVDAMRLTEGGGFPVRRPFPSRDLPLVDPFLLLDHMGPVNWAPGEAIGAPDHPHRGFETVTYMLEGKMQHKDSGGHSGLLGPGDVQWMTAGYGVVHSELPEAEFKRNGGVMNGIQIWVNLPASMKLTPLRYQEIPSQAIPEATSADGRVKVRVIAGEAMGVSAVIDTHTPIVYLHYVIQPGGQVVQSIPLEHNALVFMLSGEVQLGPNATPVSEAQLALLSAGDKLSLAVPADAAEEASLLILAGVPLNEPIARYGPFVMNSEAEIRQAIADFRAGKMGEINF